MESFKLTGEVDTVYFCCSSLSNTFHNCDTGVKMRGFFFQIYAVFFFECTEHSFENKTKCYNFFIILYVTISDHAG